MNVGRCIGLGLVLIVVPLCQGRVKSHNKSPIKEPSIHSDTVSQELRDVARRMFSDAGSIFYNLPSLSTFKTACYGVPLYLLSRPIDHKIQHHFYDYVLCKNRNQPSKTLAKIGMNAGVALSLPVVLMDVISNESRRIRRGEIFGTGMLTVWGTKNLIKLIRTEANKRPCHEKFSTSLHHRAYGGNPSGHMAFLGYAAAFWSAEKGMIVGVPMAGFMALCTGLLVTSNRHYLSQAIAGAFYGIAFGLAAHKVFNVASSGENGPQVSMVASPEDGLGFKLSYDF